MGLRKLGSLVGITCLLALAFLVLPATEASACSCAGPRSPDDYLRGAEVAFLGDVIAARIADPESVIQGEARLASPEMIYTVDVQDAYKGAVEKREEVVSSLAGASCGAGLQINHRYVIYATNGASESGEALLYTGLCHGTYEPDGVDSFPLDSDGPPLVEPARPDIDVVSPIPLGDVEHGPSGSVSLGAFAGLMLLSAAIAGALIALAGRT